jgi:hypothetical protein
MKEHTADHDAGFSFNQAMVALSRSFWHIARVLLPHTSACAWLGPKRWVWFNRCMLDELLQATAVSGHKRNHGG